MLLARVESEPKRARDFNKIFTQQGLWLLSYPELRLNKKIELK